MSARSPIPKATVNSAERLLFYNYIEQIERPTSTNTVLLLGGPGVGKSAITLQAFSRLVDTLVYAYLMRELNGDIQAFGQQVLEELRKRNYEINDTVLGVLQEKMEYLTSIVNGVAKKNTEYFRVFEEDYKSVTALLDEYRRGGKYSRLYNRYISAPAIVAKSVVAEVEKKGSTKGFVILFDTELPSGVYIDGATYVLLNMGLARPETFGGVPYVKQDGVAVVPPQWAVAVSVSKIGLVNLDEFTNEAPKAVQTLAYSITLNKMAGTFYFGSTDTHGGIVTATGNTKTTSILVTALPGPLFTGRVEQVLVLPPFVEDWIEYMNRKHGKQWVKSIGILLTVFSTHSKLYKELSGAVKDILNNIRSKIAGEFRDPFYPPDNVVKKYSRIVPGETPNFPSPRAWEHLSVQLYDKLKIYMATGNESVLKIAEKELNTLGMPLFTKAVLTLVNKIDKSKTRISAGNTLDVIKELLNLREATKQIEKMINVNNLDKFVDTLIELISNLIVGLSLLSVEVARAVASKKKTPAVEYFLKLEEEVNRYRRRGNIYQKLVAVLVQVIFQTTTNSSMNTVAKQVEVVAKF